jgi:hypothetical protein
MRFPKKTILTVGLALMFVACGQGPGTSRGEALGGERKEPKKDWPQYSDSVIEIQMDSIAEWIVEGRNAMQSYYDALNALEKKVRILESAQTTTVRAMLDSIRITGVLPPPPPPCNQPGFCEW